MPGKRALGRRRLVDQAFDELGNEMPQKFWEFSSCSTNSTPYVEVPARAARMDTIRAATCFPRWFFKVTTEPTARSRHRCKAAPWRFRLVAFAGIVNGLF